jgi:hypothetical protein
MALPCHLRLLPILRRDPMTIAHNPRMLPSIRAIASTRALPRNHLAVFRDTVAVLRVDITLRLLRLVLRRRPREVISANLNIIVRELTQLVVVHAEELGLFAGAEVQTGDIVDEVGEQEGDHEGIRDAGDNVGDLDVQLLVVVVEPAAGDDAGVDAVEANDVVGGEEGVEDEPDDAGDAVLGEHIHAVVNADPELDFSGVIADYAGDDAEDDGRPRGNETGGGGGGYETGDTAGTPAYHGPWSLLVIWMRLVEKG